MLYRRSRLASFCFALAVFGVTSTSRAEKTRADVPFSDSAGGYSYLFTDDVMQAGAFTPNDARVVVASRVQRVTLIRPRTAFVAELLKSVENL
jgi:hypothetical protein